MCTNWCFFNTLKKKDKVLHFEFATCVLDQLADGTGYLNGVVFMDIATFNTSDVVNRHSCHLQGAENSKEIVHYVCDSVTISV